MKVLTGWLPEGVKRPLRALRRRVRGALRPWVPAQYFVATHIPVLMGVARICRVRRVLELGSGVYSTVTFLDRKAFPELESMTSYENDIEWGNEVAALTRGDGRMTLRVAPGQVADAIRDLDITTYDLLLIDDSITTAERVATIRTIVPRLSQTQIAAIHDYEIMDYQLASASAPYRMRFDSMNPNTGLVFGSVPADLRRLERLKAVIDKHARRVDPREVARWAAIFADELEP